MRRGLVGLLIVCLGLVLAGCVERTIKTGVPVVAPKPTPPLKVEPGISVTDFRALCNYLPDEGDQMNESGETTTITLGTTKRRQNPAAMRAGCTPGKTFTFTGPEQKLETSN